MCGCVKLWVKRTLGVDIGQETQNQEGAKLGALTFGLKMPT